MYVPAVAPTLLCLIRHAESTWNAAGRWQGHGDSPLSELGRAQAEALAGALASQSLEGIVCSDLARTRATAAALARVTGLDLRLEPGLRELDVGRWTGLTRDEIRRRDPALLARFDTGDVDARPPGGESRCELRGRAELAAACIAHAEPGRRLAVVTHLGVIRELAGVDFLPNIGRCWIEWPGGPPLAAARARAPA